MPTSSLIALIDDITSVLDDVALLTKVAAKKTTGVLGDDLALNAEQVTGVSADRELPVVWAVAKGSAVNKAILVPVALSISALAPWAVVPLLMVGGSYLCFEGAEKIAHKLLHKKGETHVELPAPPVDPVAFEKEKIKGAVRTDFVLSAEIITITLGTVATAPFITRVAVMTGIAILMTIGVYGAVAAIVKLDDLGLYLNKRQGTLPRLIGTAILKAAPYLMKSLSIAGTVAMFLVGGGILTHGIPGLQRSIEAMVDGRVRWLVTLVPPLFNALVGLIAGALVLVVVSLGKRMVRKSA